MRRPLWTCPKYKRPVAEWRDASHVGSTESCRIWFQLPCKFGNLQTFVGSQKVWVVWILKSIRSLFPIQRPSLRHRRDHSDSARWKCPENGPRGSPFGTWPEQTRMILDHFCGILGDNCGLEDKTNDIPWSILLSAFCLLFFRELNPARGICFDTASLPFNQFEESVGLRNEPPPLTHIMASWPG